MLNESSGSQTTKWGNFQAKSIAFTVQKRSAHLRQNYHQVTINSKVYFLIQKIVCVRILRIIALVRNKHGLPIPSRPLRTKLMGKVVVTAFVIFIEFSDQFVMQLSPPLPLSRIYRAMNRKKCRWRLLASSTRRDQILQCTCYTDCVIICTSPMERSNTLGASITSICIYERSRRAYIEIR